MKKIRSIVVALIFIFSTQLCCAQTSNVNVDFFKAQITNIQNKNEEVSMDGIKTYVQNITLKGLEGAWKGEKIEISNSEFNSISPDAYKKDDVMMISHNKDENGTDHFEIFDFVRESPIYFLGFLFIVLVIIIGRFKGVKALLSLTLSFFIIVGFIIPQIVSGGDPVMISAIGSIIIAFFSLYITYGWRRFSHIAAISLGLSLILTVIISQMFTVYTKLTGNTAEEITYLSQLLGPNFNAKGLLLAGFIIGALGVLDDVVINQISLIEELHKLNPTLHWRQLFQKGLKVGIDHISAIVNTLFLAYVGTSLPLLLLFVSDKSIHYGFTTIINMEIIATEIVRTLAGSLGLILAVPISTLIGAIFISRQSHSHHKDLPAHHHHAH